MSKSRPEAAAVFDVGKSNVRLSAVSDDGVALATIERPNRVNGGDPYPHFDADELYAWLIDGLATLARDFEIHSVVPVTHGASAALVDDDGLVLPIMDYEFRGVSEIDSEYDAMARDFARTASPKLPAGLNLGRQLFWQQRKFPRGIRSRNDSALPAILGGTLVRRPHVGADIAGLSYRSLGAATRRVFILRKDDAMGLAIWPARKRMDAAWTAVARGRRGDRSFARVQDSCRNT